MPDFTRYVAYFRVSTDKQGKSGLGLEAQQQAVKAFRAENSRVLGQYIEVESGTNCDRPELQKALAHAKRSKAVLIVAKLDRLARNARFLLTIMEGISDGGVVFCDFPVIPPGPIGKLIVTVMAAIAEFESGVTSERTKAALEALKARGVKLGAARPGHWDGKTADGRSMQEARLSGLAKGRAKSIETRRIQKNQRYADIRDLIIAKRSEGRSWEQVAAYLNRMGHATHGGGRWHATQARRAAK